MHHSKYQRPQERFDHLVARRKPLSSPIPGLSSRRLRGFLAREPAQLSGDHRRGGERQLTGPAASGKEDLYRGRRSIDRVGRSRHCKRRNDSVRILGSQHSSHAGHSPVLEGHLGRFSNCARGGERGRNRVSIQQSRSSEELGIDNLRVKEGLLVIGVKRRGSFSF